MIRINYYQEDITQQTNSALSRIIQYFMRQYYPQHYYSLIKININNQLLFRVQTIEELFLNSNSNDFNILSIIETNKNIYLYRNMYNQDNTQYKYFFLAAGNEEETVNVLGFFKILYTILTPQSEQFIQQLNQIISSEEVQRLFILGANCIVTQADTMYFLAKQEMYNNIISTQNKLIRLCNEIDQYYQKQNNIQNSFYSDLRKDLPDTIINYCIKKYQCAQLQDTFEQDVKEYTKFFQTIFDYGSVDLLLEKTHKVLYDVIRSKECIKQLNLENINTLQTTINTFDCVDNNKDRQFRDTLLLLQELFLEFRDDEEEVEEDEEVEEEDEEVDEEYVLKALLNSSVSSVSSISSISSVSSISSTSLNDLNSLSS